jgi:hypothetical protein
VLEVLVSDVATVVVVLVTVTVILRVCADVKLVVTLVEVEQLETVLVAMLVLEVDEAPSVVEPEVLVITCINFEENIEAAVVVSLDGILFVCVWARATDPELNDKSKAKKEMVMRM